MITQIVCGGCGKHLEAKSEVTSRSVCPRCGGQLGVAAKEPSHPEAAAPLSPAERLALAIKRPEQPEPPPLDDCPTGVRNRDITLPPPEPRPEPPVIPMEEHWYQCIWCPLRAWWLCLGVGLFSTALCVCIPGLVPRLIGSETTQPVLVALARFGVGLLLVLIVAVPFSFLESVLTAAVKGEVDGIRWTGGPPLLFLRTTGRWLSCFLAGPVVFAGIAFAYLLYCGDPSLTDWLILTELGGVAFAYWLFALVAVTDRGRLRAVNPVAVIDLVHRLGWRALGAVLVAALLLQAHGWVVFAGIAAVHESTGKSVLILSCAWVSGVFCMTFFCRLLGVWCHRSRPPHAVAA